MFLIIPVQTETLVLNHKNDFYLYFNLSVISENGNEQIIVLITIGVYTNCD